MADLYKNRIIIIKEQQESQKNQTGRKGIY